MSTQQVSRHPLLERVREAQAGLRSLAETEPVYLTTEVKEAALVELAALETQVGELKLRVLAAADDVAERHGARNVGAWLAHVANLDPRVGHAEMMLARSLDTRCPRTAAGMRAGVVNLAQARVIVHALDKLPADLDRFTRTAAEDELVRLAPELAPKDLKILGERILELVAPEIAEAELGKALEREERRAREKCSLHIHDQGDRTAKIVARIPISEAARLGSYLDAFTSPRKHETALHGEEDRIPQHRLRGQAFCALIERLDPERLPDHGGDATVVTVTIDYQALLGRLGHATIDGGVSGGVDGEVTISAEQARRLACTARILPAVLGGRGEVLDLGRARRLYTPGQRKALRLRDKRCRAEGCSIPARWCEAHHLKPWSAGGRTDLDDGVLFCNHHHHRAHDTRYAMDKLPSGDYRFHRRT